MTTSCPIKPVPPRINRVLFMIGPLSHSWFVPDSPLFYHDSLSDHYPAIQCGDKSSICYSKRRFVTNTGSRATIYTAEKLLRLLVRRFFGGYNIIERGSMNAGEVKKNAIGENITYTFVPKSKTR